MKKILGNSRGAVHVAVIAVVAIVVVAVGLYMSGIIKLPGGQKGLSVSEVKTLLPQNTQAFLLGESNETLDTKQQTDMIDQIFKMIDENDLKKMKDKTGIDLTPEFVKSFSSIEVAAGLWPKKHDSLVEAIEAIDSKKDKTALGFLAMLTYSGGEPLNDLIDKANAANKEPSSKWEKQDFENGFIYTIKGNAEVAVYVRDRQLLVASSIDDLKAAFDRRSSGSANFSENALYQKAIKKAKTGQVSGLFIDVQSNLMSALEKNNPAKYAKLPVEVKSLLGAMEYVYSSSTFESSKKSIWTQTLIHVDRSKSGPIGEVLFSDKKRDGFFASSVTSDKNSVLFSIALGNLWNDIYGIMEAMPLLQPMKDMPAMRLQSLGVDLQKDILDVLSGELSVALDFSELYKGAYDEFDPAAVLQEKVKSNGAVYLGIKDQAKAKELLLKSAGSMSPAATEYKSTTIHSIAMLGVSYAFVKDFLIVSGSDQVIKDTIDQIELGQVLSKKPIFTRQDSGMTNPYMMSYFDMKAYMEGVNLMLESEKKKASNKDLEMLSKLLKVYIASMPSSDSRSVVGTSPDGIVMDGYMEF